MRETYPGCGPESYPLQAGVGNAKTHDDFNAPENVTVSCRKDGNVFMFDYTVSEPAPCIHALARIDLLVNGAVVQRFYENLTGGSIPVDLKEFQNQVVRYRIAAWDMALNCTLSEEKELVVA
ncbi:MAG: hypothetical protein QHH04_04680 [Methanolinea sp.]|nr:hypothetical protein [Methanolinea sp.]